MWETVSSRLRYFPNSDVLLFCITPSVSYSPGGNRVSALCLSVRLSVCVTLIVQSLSLSLCLSGALSFLLSPISIQCRDSTCYPMSWLVQRQKPVVVEDSRLQYCMVRLHLRQGLNVLGVAVVTTLPHKLHQPAILKFKT